MENIGVYSQVTEFTTAHAGTAEWCRCEKNGKLYFAKKFQNPVFPTDDLGLPPDKKEKRKRRFMRAINDKRRMYDALRAHNDDESMIVPVEAFNYQNHVCTIAEFFRGNIEPERVKELSAWQKTILMRTLTLSLMHVHDAGIVHSDMKPDNVLILQNEKGGCELKLIDFDGSFFEDTPPGTSDDVHGDPAYFAPECYRKAMGDSVRLDRKIDMFALGCIFHYFWCGRLPGRPEGETVGQCVLAGHRITCDPSLPGQLQELLDHLLCVNPAERYDCSRVYDELRLLLKTCEKEIVKLKIEPEHPEEKHDTDTSVPEKPKTCTVFVFHEDINGHVITKEEYTMKAGEKRLFGHKEFEKYTAADNRKLAITVNKDGIPDKRRITFRYERKRSNAWLTVLLVLGCIILTSFILSFISRISMMW